MKRKVAAPSSLCLYVYAIFESKSTIDHLIAGPPRDIMGPGRNEKIEALMTSVQICKLKDQKTANWLGNIKYNQNENIYKIVAKQFITF